MKKTIAMITICVGMFYTHVQAQLEGESFHYGFSLGGTMSKIGDIRTTLIRPVFPVETYNVSEEYRMGGTAGFFIFYRFDNSKFAIQPEFSYAMLGGDFLYDDIEALEYTIAFKYQYFNLATLVKVYPAGGLFVGLGPQIGLNINNTNLTYNSNMPELGPDLQIQQSLREVLKGKSDFSILAALGYEFEMGLILEARYKLGLTDVIETQSNGFNFIENENLSRGFQFTVGFAIPFYN
jgi:hypothetical protein